MALYFQIVYYNVLLCSPTDYPVLLCDISCTTAVKKRTVESYDDLVDMAEADMIVSLSVYLHNAQF